MFMASTSHSDTQPQPEDVSEGPSTSASTGSSTRTFVMYDPHTSKLALQSETLSEKRFHVFLSFGGPDVRKTLVDHLYETLSAAGLNVFLDSDKLEKGKNIGLTFENPIEDSAVRIPIFSEGYADSAWCLMQAAAMLKTSGLIIPLYYLVDPIHVKYPESESSPYRKSFRQHSDRFPKEIIDEWKCALQQICSRSGWSTDTTEGLEVQLIKIVVNDMIKSFDRVPLEVANHPVGLDTLKKALIQNLNLNSIKEVAKLGIWGIGGSGKTTLAKAIYNQIYTDFEAASLIFNVRSTAAERTGLPDLQKQILKDITRYDGEVQSVEHGISLFRDRLGGRRVLLILDDVDALVQLNALLGDWLAPGGRIIITSRDERILHGAGVSSECIHRMSGLESDGALQLFSWCAFLIAFPSLKYEHLSQGIVEACKGHPLSLEVIGSFLHDKHDNIDCWTETLKELKVNPEIHQRLHICYSSLSEKEKEIFLDIACFFVGEHKALPIVFWKSLYNTVDSAVSDLSMLLLIKIDDKGLFDMHDQFRDMGRSIAEKEREGSRLWKTTHLKTMYNNKNCSRLRINESYLERLEMLYTPGLRYLHLQNLCTEGMTEDTLAMLPPSLIWIRFESCVFRIERERAVKKTRHSGNVWQSKIMEIKGCSGLDSHFISSLFSFPITQLQHFSVEGCEDLNNLPSSISKLSQLQHLDLGWCESLVSLPDATGYLSELKHLNLRYCESLISLPNTIASLSQLQRLELGGCRSLNELSDSIGNLPQLQYLGLEGCININNLPDTIGNLSHLQHLDLEGCININSLPHSIGNLSQLQYLGLEGCININKLPDTIGNLSQLQHLSLERCINLKNLPPTVGNLSELQHLNLVWCGRLKNLPETIGKLSQLQLLKLRGCERLNILPCAIIKLSKLQYFF